MGKRKRTMAEKLKEERKNTAFAKLNACPTSPRKMRLIADLIRGVEVSRALDILKYSKQAASGSLEKLLKSAINNWEAKNSGSKDMDEGNLCVKSICVNEGKILKRIQPAPQGRAHRIRKRSNHVTIVLGSKASAIEDVKAEETSSEAKTAEKTGAKVAKKATAKTSKAKKVTKKTAEEK